MAKWADYLVSAASYNPDREITEIEVHEDLDGSMGPAEIIDKLTMSHNLRKGKSYVTIFRTLDSWKRGQEISMFSVGGNPYIRIDKNRVSLDNLGDIPDIDRTKKKDPSLTDTTHTGEKPAPPPPKPAGAPKPEAKPLPEPEPEPEPEPQPQPEPEPVEEKPASPHGTLPAAGEVEIPFEDVQPELAPADAAPPEPEPEPPEAEEGPKAKPDQEFLDYEQDYLRRLEAQRRQEEELAEQARAEQARQEEDERRARLRREEEERQKHKAGTKPEEASGSPRGPLPAEGEVAIPFEDVQPELAPADAAPSEPEPPAVAEEPPSSPRGPLPADGEIDVPFEQVQPPEAETSLSEDEEMDFDDEDGDEDPTPEQLARFEELEKQLEEIIQQSEQVEAEPEPAEEEAGPEDLAKLKASERQVADLEGTKARADAEPEEPAGSPHGTLPASGEVEVPFEETQPEQAAEPEPEDEAAAEQYEQIAALSDKIRELETALANAPKIEPTPEPETVDGMIERLDETSDEQIEQLERLEEQIGEIEDVDIESTILAKLHRQMDRLNAIEERISGSQEATQEQIDRAAALEKQLAELEEKKRQADAASVVAYCVRCKAKRSMSDPEETTMKNGRPATKGTCSVCGAKMFRIGGSKPKPKDDAPTKEQLDRVAKLEKQIADLESRQPGATVNGYCVRCRSRRDMASPEQTTMKNGKPAIRGTCSACGARMFKIGKM